VYLITKRFPADQRFGLMSQMRRAAVSVPSNIAEGQARRSTGEFVQFVSISLGSLAELETQE
jgi:four helix bundle protein